MLRNYSGMGGVRGVGQLPPTGASAFASLSCLFSWNVRDLKVPSVNGFWCTQWL